MQDKRRHERTPLTLDVVVEWSGDRSVRGNATNLSLGGMFIEASEAPAFGAQVTVVCRLPKLGEARLPAVVRWNKPSGFGVQFGLLGARETHAIGQLVRG